MSKIEPHKSSIGDLDANVMTLIIYIACIVLSWIPVVRYFTWLIPVAVYLFEKKSSFVKGQALQTTLLFIVSAAFSLFIWLIMPKSVVSILKHATWVGFLGIISTVVGIAITVIAILSIVKAYNYEEYEIPFVGKYSSKLEEILNKFVKSGPIETTVEPVKETPTQANEDNSENK